MCDGAFFSRPNPPAMSASRPDDLAAASDASRLQTAFSQLLPLVVDQQGGLLSVKDAASGRYVFVNDAMAAWLGVPSAEVPGRTDAELLEPSVATALRAAEQTALGQAGVLISD